ncbi:MAG: redoxin domain-containing protein [Paracoccaceae bacterium]
MLLPRKKAPDLTLPTIDHGAFGLSREAAERGTVICVYRGLRRPLCATYLTEFQKRAADSEASGVGTIAVSSDGEDRARHGREDRRRRAPRRI